MYIIATGGSNLIPSSLSYVIDRSCQHCYANYKAIPIFKCCCSGVLRVDCLKLKIKTALKSAETETGVHACVCGSVY